MSIAPAPQDLLRFLARDGEEATFGILFGVVGLASRAVGAQVAVAEDGRFCGSFSSGCIEAGVIAEALDVLARGRGRTVRFDAGSRYIDFKLP